MTGIYDEFGAKLGGYNYDAWGKILSQTANEIVTLNPFRYRGYYYDTETSLYYLNTRYYDPETGRFISPDAIDYLDPATINGLNLYAYCGNNPVMYVDPEGNFPILITFVLAAFAVAGMVTAGVIGHNQGKQDWELFGFIMLGGAVGLATGGLIVATIGAGTTVLGAAGLATPVLGVTAAQAFAIGALAYNFIAIIVAPIIGIEMQPIEWGNPSYKPERPGEAPKHPSERKSILASKGYWEISKQKRRTAKSD